jgi:hypothetical protein
MKASKVSRKLITEKLTEAAKHYLIKKLYSVYFEVGVQTKKKGSLRADVLAFNMSRQFVICEVKSCWEDYKKDIKWKKYLPFCNKMYFVLNRDLCDSVKGEAIKKETKKLGVGILRLGEEGKLSVVQNAKTKKLEKEKAEWLITKLAWRGGSSRYNHKRLKRVYI